MDLAEAAPDLRHLAQVWVVWRSPQVEYMVK